MNKEDVDKWLKEAREVAETLKKEAGVETETKSEVSTGVDIEKLADTIMTRMAEAVAEKNGYNGDTDVDNFRNKLFNPKDKNHGFAYPDNTNMLAHLDDNEKIALYWKSLYDKNSDQAADRVFKALSEGTDADGGYMVPAPLSAEIFRLLPDMSVMRKIARTVPMNAQTLDLTTLAGSPIAYWTAEYANKTTTSADFARVTLTANTLACLLPATRELVADANVNVINMITELFAEAIAEAEDRAFFTGSGTGQPKGINQETISSIAAGASLTADTLIGCMHRVSQRTRATGVWVANSEAIRLIKELKDTTNNYIWKASQSTGLSGDFADMLLGKKIYEQNHLSENEIYFGDFKNYIIGDRQQISVEVSNVGGDAWRRHSVEVKAVERVDGRTVQTGAFAKITGV